MRARGAYEAEGWWYGIIEGVKDEKVMKYSIIRVRGGCKKKARPRFKERFHDRTT